MAITLPSGCWRQPTESLGVDSSGSASFNYVAKGPYAALKSVMNGLSQGDEADDGWLVNSMSLQRGRGGSGVLTISCVPAIEYEQEEEQQPEQKPLKDIWSIKSVRNDISVMAYCGPSGGQNPLRELIEGWMKESDGDLASSNSFRKPNGVIRTITERPTLALLNKVRKGVDSVIRFYPVVTRTRVYQSVPPACLENLGFIDTPSFSGAAASITKRPNGLSTAIAAHQWLKCQDDCSEDTEGNWQRVESWMGIKKTEGNSQPWDEDLYGTNRWDMPYHAN